MSSHFSLVTYNDLRKLGVFFFNSSVHFTFMKVISFIKPFLDRHPAYVNSNFPTAAGIPATVVGSGS